MPPQVVVDTMVASAWLANRQVERQVRWLRVLAQALWILPFVVVAEMRFGAEVAGWGPRRRARLENVIARAAVVPPLEDITDAYVDLRTWSVRNGHGLSAKSHEADRWVAAVAIAGELPLATEDSIFDDVPMLRLLDPDGA
ncbi:PIN domain-containing protein [Candidatus Poriferisocius sp.]|uniref:PIN domain-containing protein n=1 Tax=Candidatus Poriferisocius sp. TaxID=3101276 RepID=UPI003B02ABBB